MNPWLGILIGLLCAAPLTIGILLLGKAACIMDEWLAEHQRQTKNKSQSIIQNQTIQFKRR
jgi:hypothetical protein